MDDITRHNFRIFRRSFRLFSSEERAEFRAMIRAEPALAAKYWGVRLHPAGAAA